MRFYWRGAADHYYIAIRQLVVVVKTRGVPQLQIIASAKFKYTRVAIAPKTFTVLDIICQNGSEDVTERVLDD